MAYTQEQINLVTDKIIDIVLNEISIASKEGMLNELLSKYEQKDSYRNYKTNLYVQPNKSKILVFGQIQGKIKDYIMHAKKLGIPENQLEFIANYEKVKQYDVSKLRNSDKYTDIFIGPIPHKLINCDDASSFIAKIIEDKLNYPKYYIATANDKLKFTITNFEDAIKKSLLYSIINK